MSGASLPVSRGVRMLVATLVVVALVGFAATQLLPLWERKNTIESGEPVNATITTADYRTENVRSAQPDYYATIEYEYTVDGRRYTSSRVLPGPRLPQPYPGRSLIPTYDAGQQVQAHYDPQNPGYAWLTTTEHTVSTRAGLVTIVGMAVALLIAYIDAERTLARRQRQFQGTPSGAVRLGQFSGVFLRALGVLAAGVVAAFVLSGALSAFLMV